MAVIVGPEISRLLARSGVMLCLLLVTDIAAADPAPKDDHPAATVTPLDPMHFCYIAGQPYSHGFVIDGQQCQEHAEGWMTPTTPSPLEWSPVSRNPAPAPKAKSP